MIPGAVIYTQYGKARHSTEAMVAGFPAAERPSTGGALAAGYDLHIFGGLQFGSLSLMQAVLREGRHYVFWDRAYLGGGTKTDRLRITKNAYQKQAVEARTLARFEAFGGKLEPWHLPNETGHVMVVPPSAAIGEVWGFRPDDWLDGICATLRQVTDRPMLVSFKGDTVPLARRLENCHCVVTWSSNVAVEAVCAGVPAFVGDTSAARPVASTLTEMRYGIEHPRKPDREAWAAALAWGQFTLAEIKSGMARTVVLGHA